MDPKLFAATFLAVFLAEMGDKTQFATMTFAASGSRWTVFAASATALVAASALAVLVGSLVAQFVPVVWIRRAAGVTFLVLGAFYLFSSPDEAPPTSSPQDAAQSGAAPDGPASDTPA